MKITNPDRVVFPEDGITKGEVADYYAKVGERILPYLSGRALSVERFPKGIGEEGFMQKNAPNHYPKDLIQRHPVPKEGGGTTTYPVIDSVEAIAYFANLGVITFHVPPVLINDETRPDWAIWDLDPPAGQTDLARKAANALRSVLDDHGVPTVPMTSGSKGYHLRTRVQPNQDSEAVAEMARGVAELAAAAHPDLMTTAFHKKNRGGRVFVDWMRNAPYATSVAPWSLRARPGAPAATPLAWDEVDTVEPDGIRLGTVLDRADPWQDLTPVDLTSPTEAVARSLEEANIELEPFDRFRAQ